MKSTAPHLFFFAGEPSGDLHGGHLVEALKQRIPTLIATGVGGPKMRAQGVDCVLRMEDFEVMGLTDVLLSLPKLWRQFYRVRDAILQSKPQGVVLIDYPGFNLRLAKALRKAGYAGKIVQYVCPSVWAHSKGRINQMVQTLDLLLAIFPFEPACFSGTGLKVDYVGNPLHEYVHNHIYDNLWMQRLGLSSTDQLIALFPGSRAGEIQRNLPALLEAAEKLQQEHSETTFALSCVHPSTTELMRTLLSKRNLNHVTLVPQEYTYELMRDCRTAIAKSGTVTLELAFHECPTVVVYKLSRINWLYAKAILRLKLPHYCIVNILRGQSVYPELIEHGFSSENIFAHAHALHSEGSTREECLKGCQQVKALFEGYAPSALAAQKITEMLRC